MSEINVTQNPKIKQDFVENVLLGDDSYFSILMQINEKLMGAKAQTIQGSEFLSKMYKGLNESITPMLTLKPFITGAEDIEKTDTTVCEVIDFVTKKCQTGDLNFLINLCKEEHFAKLMRSGHPSPEQTIKSIEKEFRKNREQIEESVKNGVLDELESSLLKDIKVSLGMSSNEIPLNESIILGENNIMYSPLAIPYYDPNIQKNLLLSTNEVLLVDEVITGDADPEQIVTVVTHPVDIPTEYQKMINALNTLRYNPETNEFRPALDWDMNIRISDEGKVILKREDGTEVTVNSEHVQDLMVESIDEYSKNPAMVSEFDPSVVRSKYAIDADNFVTLALNFDQLIRMDNVTVIQDISESNRFVMFPKDTKVPIMLSNGSEKNKKYNLFSDMIKDMGTVLNEHAIIPLFESQLNLEAEAIENNRSKLVKLHESQSVINEKIRENNSLLDLAEPNSPASIKLKSLSESLDAKLTKNFEDINNCKKFTETLYW